MKGKAVSGTMLTLLLTSMLTLAFNIQPVRASGTIYIRSDGSVEGTDKIQRDGDIYTFTDDIYDEIVVEKSDILVDGAGHSLQGSGSGKGFDLRVLTNNVTIRNTNIKNYSTGIFAVFSSLHTIIGNNITNNGAAIDILESYNNSISENNIEASAGSGIILFGSSTNNISNNVITNNARGIVLESSRYNSISGNQLTNNREAGILEEASWYNDISGNQITNNYNGIWLFMGNTGNSISGNNVTNNRYGIRFDRSWGNSVSGNKITANEFGIDFYECCGIDISGNNITNNGYGIVAWSWSGNLVYHNNFINNTNQVYAWWWTSTWDDGYPSGGNYWSDHIKVDRRSGVYQDKPGSDGIVDEPYIINDYNRDNYPLVEPWGPRPPRPREDLAELIETIKSWNLSKGTENSLTSKLEEATLLLIMGNENGAIHKLMDFVNQVEALREEKLTIEQANYLISEAQRIIDLIEE